MHTILQGWAEEFGPIFAFRLFRRPVVVIADVELIHRVLRDRPEGFRRRTAIRDAMRELGIDGLFVAEGADWRRQRKLTMHALNTDHLRDFFGRLEQVTGRLQRRWERAADEGSRVDAQRDLMRFTVDVTSGLVFGYDLNTLEQRADAIQQHLGKMFPALLRRLLAPVRVLALRQAARRPRARRGGRGGPQARRRADRARPRAARAGARAARAARQSARGHHRGAGRGNGRVQRP